MSDAFSTGMNALQLSWDVPYRILASLMSIGCLCVLFGWFTAASPLNALGEIGAYLGLPQAQEIFLGLSSWLFERRAAVGPVATLLMFLGLTVNVGDGSGRNVIPSPWRGAPTALIALTVTWETWSKGPALVALFIALLFAYLMNFRKSEFERGGWIGSTFVNLLGSVLFVLAPIIWMVSRTSPKAAHK